MSLIFFSNFPYLIRFHCNTGLADHDNYHAFCRLLGRFKVNYQVSQMLLLILPVSRIIFKPISFNCRHGFMVFFHLRFLYETHI